MIALLHLYSLCSRNDCIGGVSDSPARWDTLLVDHIFPFSSIRSGNDTQHQAVHMTLKTYAKHHITSSFHTIFTIFTGFWQCCTNRGGRFRDFDGHERQATLLQNRKNSAIIFAGTFIRALAQKSVQMKQVDNADPSVGIPSRACDLQ